MGDAMTVWIIEITTTSGLFERREYTGEISNYFASLDEEDIAKVVAYPKTVSSEEHLAPPLAAK